MHEEDYIKIFVPTYEAGKEPVPELQLDLPLDNLSPGKRGETGHSYHVPVEVWKLLEGLDWHLYEANVFQGLRDAVEEYRRLFEGAEGEGVYQIAIWTDAQAQQTAISFETRLHAEAVIQKSAEYWQNRGDELYAQEIRDLDFNGNPADFRFDRFHVVSHPELIRLQKLDYADRAQSIAADVHIEVALLRVIERVLAEGIMRELPREEAIWIGISSPRDWYDHVRKIAP